MRGLVAGCALAVCACASEKEARRTPAPVDPVALAYPGLTREQVAQLVAERVAAARVRGDGECKPLDARGVPWDEEHFFGAALAIELVRQVTLVDAQSPRQAYVQVVGLQVAGALRRPEVEWTFGVFDDSTPKLVVAMGGYVLVSTGLFAKTKNEAELAAVLALGVARAEGLEVKRYVRARAAACRVALTAHHVVSVTASSAPGLEAFVPDSRFGIAMRKFALHDPFYVGDERVDRSFVAWFIGHVVETERLEGDRDEELGELGREAFGLLERAGYDASTLAPMLTELDPVRYAPALAATSALSPKAGGKRPELPPALESVP